MNSAAPQIETDGFLPARAVWERYSVTAMSLYRWLADDTLVFPRPVYIGRFRYWRRSELEEWERTRPRVHQRKTAAEDTDHNQPAAV